MKPKRAHRLLPLHKAGMEEQLAAVETAKYVPSPMDYSLLVPQLLGMGFLAVCLAYYQLVLAPTAQVKFSMSDKDKRARIREKIADESKPFQRWLYRLWLKPLARPRGDQTRGGTVIPGLTDTQGSSAKSSKSGNTERGD